MRQIIKSKYIGPTNFKGSRVKASCEAGNLIMNWSNELSSEKNHVRAITLLHKKLGWDKFNKLIFGWDKCSLIAVQVPKRKMKTK